MEMVSKEASAPDDPCVAYIPRADATLEGELAALAAAYRFVLDRRERAERPKATGRDAEEAAGDDS